MPCAAASRAFRWLSGVAVAALVSAGGAGCERPAEPNVKTAAATGGATGDGTTTSPAVNAEPPACCAGLEKIERRSRIAEAAGAELVAAGNGGAGAAVATESAVEEVDLAPSPYAATVGSIQLSEDPNIADTIVGQKVDLDLTFTDEDGREVNLARDYAGRTLVVSTIFTSCPTPTACPRIAADFGQMARALPAAHADKVRFLLVSFDPRNDAPEVLKVWGRNQGVPLDRVDLLVGDVETTKKLVLDGLQLPLEMDMATGMFSNHPLMVHVINPDGVIVVERTAASSEMVETLNAEIARAVSMPFVAPTEKMSG